MCCSTLCSAVLCDGCVWMFDGICVCNFPVRVHFSFFFSCSPVCIGIDKRDFHENRTSYNIHWFSLFHCVHWISAHTHSSYETLSWPRHFCDFLNNSIPGHRMLLTSNHWLDINGFDSIQLYLMMVRMLSWSMHFVIYFVLNRTFCIDVQHCEHTRSTMPIFPLVQSYLRSP